MIWLWCWDGVCFRDEKKGIRGLFLFLFTFSPKSGKKRITCIDMPVFQYICYALFPKLNSREMRVLQRDIKERPWCFSLWSREFMKHFTWFFEAHALSSRGRCGLKEAPVSLTRTPFHCWCWGTWTGSQCFSGRPWMRSHTVQFQLCFSTHLGHNPEQVALGALVVLL